MQQTVKHSALFNIRCLLAYGLCCGEIFCNIDKREENISQIAPAAHRSVLLAFCSDVCALWRNRWMMYRPSDYHKNILGIVKAGRYLSCLLLPPTLLFNALGYLPFCAACATFCGEHHSERKHFRGSAAACWRRCALAAARKIYYAGTVRGAALRSIRASGRRKSVAGVSSGHALRAGRRYHQRSGVFLIITSFNIFQFCPLIVGQSHLPGVKIIASAKPFSYLDRG